MKEYVRKFRPIKAKLDEIFTESSLTSEEMMAIVTAIDIYEEQEVEMEERIWEAIFQLGA